MVSPSGTPPIRMHFRFPTLLHKRFGALLICRWLELMILKPDGCIRRAKRPKFLDDVYVCADFWGECIVLVLVFLLGPFTKFSEA